MEKKAKRYYFFSGEDCFLNPAHRTFGSTDFLIISGAVNEFLVRLQPRLNNVFKRHTAVPIESVTVNNRLILLVKKYKNTIYLILRLNT